MLFCPLIAVVDSLSVIGLLIVYSAIIVTASVFGGLLPNLIQFTHTRLQMLISYVGGLMLGVAVFHLLPHAIREVGDEGIDQIAWSVMIGMLVMFFLLRAFHFHQHGPADFGHLGDKTVCDHHDHGPTLVNLSQPITNDAGSIAHRPAQTSIAKGHDHSASHTESHAASHHGHLHSVRSLGVLVGLGIHTLFDGMALAAAVQADAHADTHLGPWGIGVFLAIVLHKPLDAISITSLMQIEGWTSKSRLLVNGGFAMMVPLGACLLTLGAMSNSELAHAWIGYSLAFSAGVFLCISLSDLLPEMEFHSHNRVWLTIALLLGIATAVAIGAVEPEHAHHHSMAHSNV